jgi:hypothetical protein
MPLLCPFFFTRLDRSNFLIVAGSQSESLSPWDPDTDYGPVDVGRRRGKVNNSCRFPLKFRTHNVQWITAWIAVVPLLLSKKNIARLTYCSAAALLARTTKWPLVGCRGGATCS